MNHNGEVAKKIERGTKEKIVNITYDRSSICTMIW